MTGLRTPANSLTTDPEFRLIYGLENTGSVLFLTGLGPCASVISFFTLVKWIFHMCVVLLGMEDESDNVEVI